jgi:hypothetical protein
MSGEFSTQLGELRNEVRTQLHQVTREVSTERIITRDLVEALHRRLDGLEAVCSEILREVRDLRKLSGNGHG